VTVRHLSIASLKVDIRCNGATGDAVLIEGHRTMASQTFGSGRTGTSTSGAWVDPVALIGRMLISAIFLLSGLSKLADPASTISYIQSAGLPLPSAGLAAAVVVELVGGLLLAVGYKTRWIAVVLAMFSLATALAFHAHFSDQNQFIHFFKNVAMAGGLLQVAAFGGGRLSIDGRR
jgi:putative oxidoreductase